MKSSASENALVQYMGRLAEQPLLNADQEKALAGDIEALELAHWRALLSYRPALDAVDDAVEKALEEPAPSLKKLRALAHARGRRQLCGGTRDPRWAPLEQAAASELRGLDVRRSALRAADAAVRRRFVSDGRARRYLTRTARAARAERRAKDRFVNANLRLVISMARRYRHSQMPLLDLIQEGNLGLMQAVERFDHRRGYRFSTYASWWIRHHINRAISCKARMVRVPVHALEDMTRASRAQQKHETATGMRMPSEVLASELGMSEQKVELLRQSGRGMNPVSLDDLLSDERAQTMHDVLPDPEPVDPDRALAVSDWRQRLDRLLCELTDIEADVLRMRFGLDDGDGLTLQEIGEKYNLSRERIRQIQVDALTKLRGAIHRDRAPGDGDDHVAA